MKRNGPIPKSLDARLWDNVDQFGPVPAHRPELGPCWVWARIPGNHGYGALKIGSRLDGSRRSELAHRLSWSLAFGDPGEASVLHACDNRLCVRPSHLFLGTQADNLADMRAKGRARDGMARGSRHGRSKLDERAVGAIRASVSSSLDLAMRFGVTAGTIRKVRGCRAWRHVR